MNSFTDITIITPVLAEILKYLTVQGILLCSTVNTAFYKAVYNDVCWEICNNSINANNFKNLTGRERVKADIMLKNFVNIHWNKENSKIIENDDTLLIREDEIYIPEFLFTSEILKSYASLDFIFSKCIEDYSNVFTFSNLTELSFSSIKNISFPDLTGIKVPSSIKNISMTFCKFTEIPECFLVKPVLQNLTRLSLTGNNITEIPEKFYYVFENLTTLKLSCNNITDFYFPKDCLSSLTDLNIDNNPLTKVPESVINLVNLKYLSIRSIGLTEFPKCFLKPGIFNNLVGLSMNENKISYVPDIFPHFKSFTNLLDLNMNSCDLTCFPNFPKNCVAGLKNLSLINNRITRFPSIPEPFAALEYLQLRDNSLNFIPIKMFPVVKQLTLSGNRFESFAFMLKTDVCQHLQLLDMSNNCIIRVPNNNTNPGILPALINLILSGNNIKLKPKTFRIYGTNRFYITN